MSYENVTVGEKKVLYISLLLSTHSYVNHLSLAVKKQNKTKQSVGEIFSLPVDILVLYEKHCGWRLLVHKRFNYGFNTKALKKLSLKLL